MPADVPEVMRLSPTREIHTISMNLLGEHWSYNFILSEETLVHPNEVSYLIEQLTAEFKHALVARFTKEMEKAHDRSRDRW